MSVVSISMPEAFLERIDEFADEHGYSGRSHEQSVDERVQMCTVTVTFEYSQPTVQQRLTAVRHEYDAIVSDSI